MPTNNRYYAQIKRIIRSVAVDPQSLEFDLSWHDFEYLKATIENYLNTKQTTQSLTTTEAQYCHNTGFDAHDHPLVLLGCYVDPNLAGVADLSRLAAEKSAMNQLPADSADHDAWQTAYHQRLAQLNAFGQQLTATDLAKFSVLPQTGWRQLPLNFLETILLAFHERHPLSTDQITQVFGVELTQSYWPIEASLPCFFQRIHETGLWLPNLISLLQDAHDPEINHLVILWLQWFKHGKTFAGDELMADGRCSRHDSPSQADH